MSYRRGWIAVFLFSLSMINYMDRIALSIAAGPIERTFHLSSVGMGYLFSSFIWSYVLCLIPMGYLIDRFGTKRIAAIGVFVWSAATALTGAASSFAGLIVARLGMGAGESSSNPIGAKAIRQWIPAHERGTISAVFNSGAYAGPAICSALLGSLVAALGWRAAFAVAGGIGFVWLVAWWIWFDEPEHARWLSAAEREKILAERGTAAATASQPAPSSGLRDLLRTPTLWGLAIAQGCNVYTQYLFLTWLPSYLQATRHLDLARTGLLSAAPYGLAVLLCIAVGRASDRLVKRDQVSAGGRRGAVAIAMLGASSILLLPFAGSLAQLIALFSVTLTGIAATTSLNFALLNDMLPDSRDVAKATAFVVAGGQVFGMAAPIVTGYVVAGTGGYDWAFRIAGLLLVAGASVVMSATRSPIGAARDARAAAAVR
ncbi:MFS transporter [Burkholderia sp. Ac-20379]|uniref:MFS transporter n=1 Tax=Burkholderia sp. Ac-20379 TaxID=2703900 RepID=UPI00197E1BE4|nr:MFS transporter [Burkholderia sp. Ac-20379]MBN3723993.1 MFS transporter [Burkholderia sp. Ac-20379]